jgi:hypothetical protein
VWSSSIGSGRAVKVEIERGAGFTVRTVVAVEE